MSFDRLKEWKDDVFGRSGPKKIALPHVYQFSKTLDCGCTLSWDGDPTVPMCPIHKGVYEEE